MSTQAIIPPDPFVPAPTTMLRIGAPVIVRWFRSTSCAKTRTPEMSAAFGTLMRSPLMWMRTGSGLRMSEWSMWKTDVARIGFPSAPRPRISPGPRAVMQAPSEVIVVRSCETQSPRVA